MISYTVRLPRVTMSASATKLYVILFVAIMTACAIAVYVKYDRRDRIEKFEENPDYKYRLEVMKVFETHLQRNPTPDEIEKYVKFGNEQDILMEITKDYKVSTRPGHDLIDSVEHLTQQPNDEKEEPKELTATSMTPRAHEDMSNFMSVDHGAGAAVVAAASTQTKKTETQKLEAFDTKDGTICISKASYDKLKSMLFSLQAEVMMMNKHI